MSSDLLRPMYVEKLSQLLLDNVSDAIISTDENFRIKTWNKAAEKIYGLSLFEAKNKRTDEILHYEFLNDSLEQSRKKLIEEGQWKGIVAFVRCDRKKVFLSASVSSLRNENNDAIGYVAVNRDITDVYQIKHLLENEQRLTFALQGAGDGVWEYNFQTKEVYYSPAYKKMLGFSEDEFPNDAQEWRGRIHPRDLAQVEDIEKKYEMGAIENHSIEYRIKNKDGRYIWMLDRGMVIEKTADEIPLKLIGTQTNIDYQKKAEEKIKTFLESAPDAIIIANEKGVVEVVNTQAEKLFRRKKGEILHKNIDALLPRDLVKNYDRDYYNPSFENMSNEVESSITRSDGEEIPVEVRLSPIHTEEGVMMLASVRDITDRKRADEALLKTKAELLNSIDRYHYASKATSDAIWDWDIATDTIYRGQGFSTIFGYEETISSLEIRMSSIIHPDDKERVRAELENALAGQALTWQSEYRFKCADGKYKYVIDKAYIIRNEKGDAVRMIGAVQDVTEQRRLEEQLASEEARKKKDVLQAIIYAQERERNEISHELHDNVSQILTTCKLLLEAAVQQNDPKYLQQTKENLQKAIDEMRKISHRLNPATLKYIGLEGSINDLVNNINNTGNININFTSLVPDMTKIHDDVQLALFRIIQEQLNNILKHANATNVAITLTHQNEKINLTIIDNGAGYDLGVKKHGLGLRNIFNRTEFYKGTAQIFTEPGKGFKLQVQIPQ
jgi:PAS domain S-box-containing protein